MHYHIRWSDSKLDWERFSTREAAEHTATQLARPGERFTLEHVEDETCIQCQKISKRVFGDDETGDTEVSS